MKNEWIVKERIELLQYLFKQMNHKSRNSVKSILSRGQVVVNGQVSKQFDDPLQPGDVISIKDRVVPTDIKLRGINILFEDDDLIVIEKNAGLLTIATDTEKEHTAYKELTYYLRKTQPKRKLFVVHRLDRDTSGLLIFAKNKETKEKIQQTSDLQKEEWKRKLKKKTTSEKQDKQPEKSQLRQKKIFVVPLCSFHPYYFPLQKK